MSWSNGIAQIGDSLRVKHSVFSGTPGLIVVAIGFAVHQDMDLGLVNQFGVSDESRPIAGYVIMVLGFVLSLWRKQTLFHADGSCEVVRHFLAIPIPVKYPRSDIQAIGTGAKTTGGSWYGRWGRQHTAEHTTYIGYVMFQNGSWTELFRCSGDKDFQERIELIKDFTGLPTRRN